MEKMAHCSKKIMHRMMCYALSARENFKPKNKKESRGTQHQNSTVTKASSLSSNQCAVATMLLHNLAVLTVNPVCMLFFPMVRCQQAISSSAHTLIPLQPSLSPSPPATRTNAALRASFTPAASSETKLSSPKVNTSPEGT